MGHPLHLLLGGHRPVLELVTPLEPAPLHLLGPDGAPLVHHVLPHLLLPVGHLDHLLEEPRPPRGEGVVEVDVGLRETGFGVGVETMVQFSLSSEPMCTLHCTPGYTEHPPDIPSIRGLTDRLLE